MLSYPTALKCACLSQEVYQDFTQIRFGGVPDAKATLFESQALGVDTQVAILHEEASSEIYIVFRGSEKTVDWITNIQFRQETYPYGDEKDTAVRFHRGFMAAYLSVRDRLLEELRKYPQCPITFTGHSLGGALATIGSLDVQYNLTQHTGQKISLYTFGAPRVGNTALVNSFKQRVTESYRFIYGWDIVTRVPRTWQGYASVPEEVLLGSLWSWQIVSRRFSDHMIGNYVAALQAKVKAES